MTLKERILESLETTPDDLGLIETLCHIQLQMGAAQLEDSQERSRVEPISLKEEIRRVIEGQDFPDGLRPREVLYQIFLGVRLAQADSAAGADRGLDQEEVEQMVASWFEAQPGGQEETGECSS